MFVHIFSFYHFELSYNSVLDLLAKSTFHGFAFIYIVECRLAHKFVFILIYLLEEE